MKPSLFINTLSIILLGIFSISSPAQNTVKFYYLGQYNNLGVPDYLEAKNDVIDQTFLNEINTALPEKKPVPSFNPNYITQSSETNIILSSQTDIWITYITEGAGFTNALGFYTYPVSNPPKSVADIKNHTIIFPNVSNDKSGGGLVSGNKVFLQNFKANTAIGWFVVVDAFKDGKLTQGKYIVYSDASLNPEKDVTLKSHTVLLNDTKRNKIVMGFEDVLRDQGSDQDFNDLLFYITASSYNAIKTDRVVKLPTTDTTSAVVTNPVNDPNQKNNGTTNNTNINIATNVTNGQTGNGSNTTITNNNVNTGTNTTTNSNNTTVINNTTIINNGTTGTNQNTSNTNVDGTRPNGNTNSNNTTNNTVVNNVTVCNQNPLALTNFNNLKSTLKAQKVESNKPAIIKQAVTNKRVTVSQVRDLLKLINIEQYKMDMAKYLFDFTCDKSNYYELSTLFLQSRVREFNTFLAGKNIEDDNVTSVNTTVTNKNNNNTYTTNTSRNNNVSNSSCDNGRMPIEDFEDIKENVKSQSFTSTQISVLKEAMNGRCISAIQVKSMLEVFSFEADKLSMAKYLYSFTTDTQNYYKVNDAFSFSSSKEELNKYINSLK